MPLSVVPFSTLKKLINQFYQTLLTSTMTCFTYGVLSLEYLSLFTVPPIIQPALSPEVANQGSQAILDCVVMGNPPPTISWVFNSVSLPNPAITRIQQSSNGSLIFSPIMKSDEGSYLCRASNSAGMESAIFQLRVYGECKNFHCCAIVSDFFLIILGF